MNASITNHELGPEKPLWKPKVEYKYKLNDIKKQLTPAEEYKRILTTTAKDERTLRRLQWKWEKNFIRWSNAALIVQSAYRGMVGRKYFKSIRHELIISKENRLAKLAVIEAFHRDSKLEALETLKDVREMNVELHIIESKISYSLGDFGKCIECAAKVIEKVGYHAEAQYLQCTSYACQEKYDQAYSEVTTLINLDHMENSMRTNAHKLRAYVAIKKNPPLFYQAINDFNFLIIENPTDPNLVLQRACAYCGVQDWTSAIADLSYILEFEPGLIHVLAIRARAYCCKRMWVQARVDYQTILDYQPDNILAKNGLEEAGDPDKNSELPMVDVE